MESIGGVKGIRRRVDVAGGGGRHVTSAAVDPPEVAAVEVDEVAGDEP